MALGVSASIATIPLVVVGTRHGSDEFVGEWVFGAFSPGFLIAGWWLLSRRPGMWIGRMYLVAGVSTALTGLAAAYAAAVYPDHGPGLAWAMWIVSIGWLVHGGAINIVLILFPGSAPRGRLDRALILAAGLGLTVVMMITAAVRPGAIVTTPDHPDGSPAGVANPIGVARLAGIVDVLDWVWLVLGVLFSVLILALIGSRWRHSTGVARRQYRWAFLVAIAWAVVVPMIVALTGGVGAILAILTTLGLQLLTVVAILRWDVYGTRVVLRRSSLAAALLAGALSVYGAVVLVAAVAVGGFGPFPATLGAMIAVFTFGPMSSWITKSVDRLFYGRRRDPYELLAALGRGQAQATTPDDALDRLVAAIATELRFPAVVLTDADGQTLCAQGDPDAAQFEEIDLQHLGRGVGTLKIARRTGTDDLSVADRRLARSLGDAVAAVVAYRRAARQLKTTNEKLVFARDAERLRFQRDLHDGLGPLLTSVVFRVDALANHLRAGRVENALGLADDARTELTSAVNEIRSYIHALGDPALATTGLRRTLIERINRLSSGAGLDTDVSVGDLATIPAAIERAVLAVVSEALTNVVRHAQATRCRITVARTTGTVQIEITDDGRGLGLARPAGVGITSMHHRVAELGGSLRIEPAQPGTRVTATIPEAP